MLLGCLAKPNTSPTECTTRKEYHFCLPERDVNAKIDLI